MRGRAIYQEHHIPSFSLIVQWDRPDGSFTPVHYVLSLSLIKLFIANLGTKDLTYIGTYLPITYYKPSLTVAPVKLAVI